MLHGFRSSHLGLLKVAAEFPNYHVIIPDFPGYGGSEALSQAHTVDACVEFLSDFLAKLGVNRMCIIGHSFGAVVGLAYAADNPMFVDNLILISPVPEANIVAHAGSIYYHIGGRLPAPLDRHWFTTRLIHRPIRNLIVRTRNPVTYAEVMQEGERELNALTPKISVQNFLSLMDINPEQWLLKIRMPTLIVAGDADPLTPLSGIISTYNRPGVEIKVIPGMGHFAPAEIPFEISDVAKKWLFAEKLTTI